MFVDIRNEGLGNYYVDLEEVVLIDLMKDNDKDDLFFWRFTTQIGSFDGSEFTNREDAEKWFKDNVVNVTECDLKMIGGE